MVQRPEEQIQALIDLAPRKLGQKGLNFIGTSIEGPRERHDKIRQKEGAFDTSCFTIRSQIDGRQMHMLDSRPVSRREIWLGKWLGIVGIAFVLELALVAALLICSLLYMRGYDSEQVADARKHYAVARYDQRPVSADLTALTKARINRLVAEGKIDGAAVDEDAWNYLVLANELIHETWPDAITVAEEVSAMPGLAAPEHELGAGFDYRMSMGVPECWFKLIRDVRDEEWSIGYLWHELTNRRDDERTVNYAECHDQAIVGGKTVLFQMADTAIYDGMHRGAGNLVAERAVALHKMIRLATLGTAGHAYLNFMGNEFGHPEWIDFPREGNRFSYHHARRLWHLRDDESLYFKALGDFDEAMLSVFTENSALTGTQPQRLVHDDEHKVLAFGRGALILCFNFHNERSLENHEIRVPPGEYDLVLDTDTEAFGGQGRIVAGQRYHALSAKHGREVVYFIRVYLPCRTAMVLRRR